MKIFKAREPTRIDIFQQHRKMLKQEVKQAILENCSIEDQMYEIDNLETNYRLFKSKFGSEAADDWLERTIVGFKDIKL